ncbi:DUF6443 domain-containing protein [Aureisphaera galaxeae]|uniref:DUF6443 domain-containing protein n=1 Tax=Aureisphaera galaxeae TaxID=1538023 RepID=UPI002350A881|nr:DUF6443 domain-containing protein [Aureisphaera galaxeae]MDC8005346.1 DUF6443 domain-containing protein [Aureisphaera galaxeae]
MTRNIIFLILLFLFSGICRSQTNTENYTKSTTYQVETQDGNVLDSEKIEAVTYYDGLNRPIQNVSVMAGGSSEDLITHIYYDSYGRQNRQYLPLPKANNNAEYYEGVNGVTIQRETADYYKAKFPDDFYQNNGLTLIPDWDNPFVETRYDDSPLSKVEETSAPGFDWRLGNGGEHTVKSSFETNNNTEVKKFTVSYDSNGTANLHYQGYYTEDKLVKSILKNENWTSGNLHTTETFTDKSGRELLTNNYVWKDNSVTKLSTYMVYDHLGRVAFKIPPEASEVIALGQYLEFSETLTQDDIVESPETTDGTGSGIIDLTSQVDGNGDTIYTLNWNFNMEYDDWAYGGTGAYFEIGQVYSIPNNGNHLTDQVLFTIESPVFPNDIWYEFALINNNLHINLRNSITHDNDPNYMFLVSTINESGQTVQTTQGNDQEILDKLVFQYKYDDQNRIIEQKTPSKGWESIIYNKLDQPILLQDANLRNQGKWLFKKYDAFGRLAYSGLYSNNLNRSALMVELTSQPIIEERLENPITLGDTNIYYSNSAYPTLNIEVLSINYYDNYIDHTGIALPTSIFGESTQVETKGLLTVNRERVLGTNDWRISLIGYDEYGRVIYAGSRNEYLLTTNAIHSKLDFTGKTTESQTTHSKAGNATITTRDYYSYDHIGRLITHQQRIDNEPTQLIVHNEFDEIGQLVRKKVGGELFKNGYTDIVNVSVSSVGVITKTGSSGAYDAGLATIGELLGDGGLSFVAGDVQKKYYAGLNDSNTGSGDGEIDYAFFFLGTGSNPNRFRVRIRENNVTIYTGPYYQYNEGDLFAIEQDGNNLHFLHNGNSIYTYDVSLSNPALVGDVSFYTPGASISNLQFYATNIDKSLQTVDYEYNVRGWLTDINNIGTVSTLLAPDTDLFKFRIIYNRDIEGSAGDPGKTIPLYNGNIAQTIWKTNNVDSQRRSYGYKYDALNRVKAAFSRVGSDLNTDDNHSIWGIDYDLNGNLMSMIRWGDNENGGAAQWDNLVYNYDGNKLLGVIDNSTSTQKYKGFNDSNNNLQDYVYDDNGNLISDANKNIVSISYNHLNLPTFVNIDNNGVGGIIEYIYDATGNKIEKKFTPSGVNPIPVITQYDGGHIYNQIGSGDNLLQFFGHPEGYVEPTPVIPTDGSDTKSVTGFDIDTGQTTYSAYNYVFQYTDHLGNVRLSYSDLNKNGAVSMSEIIEESHYYPFGLKHQGYNSGITGGGNAIAQQWKFGGKQLQSELDLSWYDFGSRNYDASIGRWFNTDPQNQFSSPYVYAFNNPIISIDPDGEFAWTPIIIGAITGFYIGGITADISGGEFLDGAWKGAVTGALGGGIGQYVSGGSFAASVASGAGSGGVTGSVGALLEGNDIGQGFLRGSITGGALAFISSSVESFQNLFSEGYFGTNDGTLKHLYKDAQKALADYKAGDMLNTELERIADEKMERAVDFFTKRYGGTSMFTGAQEVETMTDKHGIITVSSHEFGEGRTVGYFKEILIHEQAHFYKDLIQEGPGLPGVWASESLSAEQQALFEFDGPIGYYETIKNSGKFRIIGPRDFSNPDRVYSLDAWKNFKTHFGRSNFVRNFWNIPRRGHLFGINLYNPANF